jgi:hypothetical protein
MKKTEQKPERTLTGTVQYEGRDVQIVDFLAELENLANTLDHAEQGVIGLGYEDMSHYVISGEILMQVRALFRAAGGKVN